MFMVTGFAWGQEPSVNSLPPSVIKTVPECGVTNVDAATTTQIQVTFSKEMMDGSWSWSQISDETFPQIVGKPRYLDDKKTCVIDVKLEPKKTYVIWLNSKKFGGFKDVNGNSSVPYLLVFQTK
jgi:RNA polymerase sigma-70 factor (ECF subfamily)